jgi:hypothetical protein
MTSMDPVSPSAYVAPTLPADRTFVVQFYASPDDAPAVALPGRAEHLVSASAARFETWSELRDFVEQVLLNVDRPPDGGSTHGGSE